MISFWGSRSSRLFLSWTVTGRGSTKIGRFWRLHSATVCTQYLIVSAESRSARSTRNRNFAPSRFIETIPSTS